VCEVQVRENRKEVEKGRGKRRMKEIEEKKGERKNGSGGDS